MSKRIKKILFWFLVVISALGALYEGGTLIMVPISRRPVFEEVTFDVSHFPRFKKVLGQRYVTQTDLVVHDINHEYDVLLLSAPGGFPSLEEIKKMPKLPSQGRSTERIHGILPKGSHFAICNVLKHRITKMGQANYSFPRLQGKITSKGKFNGYKVMLHNLTNFSSPAPKKTTIAPLTILDRFAVRVSDKMEIKEGLEIYLLEKTRHNEVPILDKIHLPDKPLLLFSDIRYYDWKTHEIILSSGGWARVRRKITRKAIEFDGLPFVLTINRQPIYIGYFWSLRYSESTETPVVFVENIEKKKFIISPEEYKRVVQNTELYNFLINCKKIKNNSNAIKQTGKRYINFSIKVLKKETKINQPIEIELRFESCRSLYRLYKHRAIGLAAAMAPDDWLSFDITSRQGRKIKFYKKDTSGVKRPYRLDFVDISPGKPYIETVRIYLHPGSKEPFPAYGLYKIKARYSYKHNPGWTDDPGLWEGSLESNLVEINIIE